MTLKLKYLLLHKLEKKSISITRLKLRWRHGNARGDLLEKKSISITRLKLHEAGTASRAAHWIYLKRKVSRLRDWNSNFIHILRNLGVGTWKEKYLDYEIETMLSVFCGGGAIATWKEKYLDYEIET